MELNGLISLCVLVCACAWLVFSACTLSASSGVWCPLNEWGKCWLRLSIKDSIDLRHESVSIPSHPWTADNRAQHGGIWLKAILKPWELNTSMQRKVWPSPSLPIAYHWDLTGKSFYFLSHLKWPCCWIEKVLNVMFMDGLLLVLAQRGTVVISSTSQLPAPQRAALNWSNV